MGGGKGKKRREKNYKEAHGIGKNRLPPPPLRSSLLNDVMPSKLRKLISISAAIDDASSAAKKLSTNQKPDSDSKIIETDNFSTTDQKKRNKRKRKQQVEDLRFVAELASKSNKKKERKKKFLAERKKKHNKPREEDDLHFPGPEDIKFGEVVQAPPKLVNLPKRFGSSVNVSQERIRLRTIEAYRDQKKWASRPGLHLPTTDLTHHNSVVLPVQKRP